MIKILNKKIGDGNPCYIVFEIGPTHNGLDSAKRLVKEAYLSGADAVKFQMMDPERLFLDNKHKIFYGVYCKKKKSN